VNSDIVASVEPEPFRQALQRHDRHVAAAWLEPRKGPRTVETARSQRITTYHAAHAGTPGTATFCGLQLVLPRIFDFLPAQPVCSLIEVYETAAAAGWSVAGVRAPRSYWEDAGTVPSYLRMHAEVRRRARRGQAGGELYDPACDGVAAGGTGGYLALAPGSTPPPGAPARLRRSVIWGGAQVAPKARLQDVVVAGGAVVAGVWHDTALIPAAAAPDESLTGAIRRLGWPLPETALSFLGDRGSNRSFWRAGYGTARAMLVRYSLERPENGRYAGHAHLLAAAGVPVPRVLLDSPESRVLALEDWGNTDLTSLMRRRGAKAEAWYEPVLAAAARLHTVATAEAFRTALPMEPSFDEALYHWEHELFRNHLLVKRYGMEGFPDGVAEELARAARMLLAAPVVVVHRDFQSSNVLFRRGRVALIDFQGMRPGAAAYDVASLLCDPYVALTPELRGRLLERYAALCPEQAASVRALFAWAAVQRLVQAMGAFGRLSQLGHRHFVSHLVPAATTLQEMAGACGLPALAALAREIRKNEGFP
jgi:aminoglycoside/choline kinase family phosphotransferase